MFLSLFLFLEFTVLQVASPDELDGGSKKRKITD